MTNSERLRKMTDGELANWFAFLGTDIADIPCSMCKYYNAEAETCDMENPCTKTYAAALFYEWLQSKYRERVK